MVNTIQISDDESHEPTQTGFSRLANPGTAPANPQSNLRQAFARAHGEGYCVHLGDADDGSLNGRYWWTLHRQGWSGIEASCGDWPTEAQAMADACRAHEAEVEHA